METVTHRGKCFGVERTSYQSNVPYPLGNHRLTPGGLPSSNLTPTVYLTPTIFWSSLTLRSTTGWHSGQSPSTDFYQDDTWYLPTRSGDQGPGSDDSPETLCSRETPVHRGGKGDLHVYSILWPIPVGKSLTLIRGSRVWSDQEKLRSITELWTPRKPGIST